MKRHGHLWEQVIRFEALLRAADTARKGKRFRPDMASCHFDQERALWKLHGPPLYA
jgi:RNA-directed DNA polymerase